MSRIIRLLAEPTLTPRQLAQRRYKASAKGKAADARYHAKRRHGAVYRAAAVARAMRWAQEHRPYQRTYDRVRRRMKRIEQAAA